MLLVVDRNLSTPLHLQMRRAIRESILNGEFEPGTALPSLRQMAQEAGVNKLTLLKAIDSLKQSGWLITVRGKGMFVADPLPQADKAMDFGPAEEQRFFEGSPFGPAPEEVADSIMETVDTAASSDYISFAAAFPPRDFIPVAQIRRRLAAILGEKGGGALGYSRTRGYDPLVGSLTDWLEGRGLVLQRHDQLLVTSGAQQAITLALQVLVRPGESVLVESPAYMGVISACRMLGIQMETVPLDSRGLDLDRLETKLRRSRFRLLYTVPNFQNPTGITLTEIRRRRILDLTRRYGVTVLEDDTYGDLRFTGKIIPPIKAMPDSGHVIYIGSFSKSISPGLRVGFLVARQDLAVRLRRMKEIHDVSSPSLSQLLADDFLRSGSYARHLRRVRRAYRKRKDAMVRTLATHFPASVRFTEPKGGLHLWVVLPDHLDVMDLQVQAKKNGILFSPGTFFFADRHGKNCMRLNFASNPPEQIEEGLERLGTLVQNMERRA